MYTRFRIKDHWAEQRMFLRRCLVAGGTALGLIAILFIKLVHLQIVRHDYYLQLSQGNRVRVEPIPPNRGLMVDRNGVILAQNQPAYQLELTAEQTPDIKAALEGLTTLGLVDKNEIPQLVRTIRSRRKFEGVPIRLHMSDEEVATFAVRRYEFPGVDIRPRLTRHYPLGDVAVHALGYVGAINEQELAQIDRDEYAGTSLLGKVGLEAQYEKELHGKPGFRQILVNAQGRTVENENLLRADLSAKAAIPGNDLLLSMDLRVQSIAEEALGERRGAVIAIDPNNGDVIALVSKPGFDPNMFSRGITAKEYQALQTNENRPLFNRAIRGTYPSGSTIKPVIALAGLTNKVIGPHSAKFCPGVWHLPNSRLLFREGKTGRHGYMDMEHAIAKSCDVYFYDLAATLNVNRITAFMAGFGYGQLTGIDIVGEKPGLLPTPEWKRKAYKRAEDQVWYPGETVNLGLGQGYLLVTPIQLAHVVSMLANRGKGFQPRLVTGIRSPEGAVRTLSPVATKPASGISNADWDTILRGMVGATTYGTAAAIGKGAQYTIAGKTGTAQVFTVSRSERLTDKVAEHLKDHSWFIGFAPVEAPKIAVIALVENGGFGSAVAAPIVRKIMDAYLLGDTEQPAAVTNEKPDEASEEPSTVEVQPPQKPSKPSAKDKP